MLKPLPPHPAGMFKAGLQGSGSRGRAGGIGAGVNTSRAQMWAGSEAGILEAPSIMLRGD